MDVYIGFTCEQAPMWLFEKYPSCRLVGRKGLPIIYETHSTLHSDGKPGPCFDHPDAMAKHVVYRKAMVKALGKYKNIAISNVWQEITCRADLHIGEQVCYCENTINHLRRWLQEKYGSLDEVRRQVQGELLVQKRIGTDREAWILTNPSDHDVTETITVPEGATVTDLLAGAVSVTEDQVRVAVKSLDVRVLIIGRSRS